MELLLDTHALIWWATDDARLGPRAREAIADEGVPVWVSAVSAMEIATKVRIGKLPGCAHLVDHLERYTHEQGFEELPITTRHALRAGMLPWDHRDPFDRLLVAQAWLDGLVLATNEAHFAAMGVRTVW